MKISRQDERSRFWRDTVGKIPHDYNRIPLKYLRCLNARDVLEIGPGNGRHTQDIKKQCKGYDVADIDQKIVSDFADRADNGHLITDYASAVGKYDAILAWFVMHHITSGELGDFLAFLKINLRPGGEIVINTPCDYRIYQGDAIKDDGMHTTERELADVIEALRDVGFDVTDEMAQSGDSYIICARLKPAVSKPLPATRKITKKLDGKTPRPNPEV